MNPLFLIGAPSEIQWAFLAGVEAIGQSKEDCPFPAAIGDTCTPDPRRPAWLAGRDLALALHLWPAARAMLQTAALAARSDPADPLVDTLDAWTAPLAAIRRASGLSENGTCALPKRRGT